MITGMKDDFLEYLSANGMSFERGKGYWEDKFYLIVKYQDEPVCFILTESESVTIWSDDDPINWLEEENTDDKTKEAAWKHVDICGNCGGCANPGGKTKYIFGKKFDKVCVTSLRFDNPDFDAYECVKTLAVLRKNYIIKRRFI